MKKYANYLGNGRVYFEARLSSGNYSLELFNSNTKFHLRSDSRRMIEGSVNWLYHELPYHHRDPELQEWLMRCLKEIDYKETVSATQYKFIVNGVSYKYKVNVTNGDLSLTFPRQIILSATENLLSDYPELELIHNGTLWRLLEGELWSAPSILHREGEFQFISPKEFLIGDKWRVTFCANNKADIVFIDLAERTINTNIDLLHDEVPELSYIHHGEYEHVLIGQLSDLGVWAD
ncbi:MAG: hypothetical protein AB7O73_13375 [Bacteroidia bacterium]